MKITKSNLTIIAILVAISFSSCSVTYRTRHPRPVRHKRVIVVGMTTPAPTPESTVVKFKQQMPVNTKNIIDDDKTK